MDGAREDTTSSKDGAIVVSKKEKEREERDSSSSSSVVSTFSRENENSTYEAYAITLDSENGAYGILIESLSREQENLLTQIRAMALMEFGINGSVDPAKIARKLHISPDHVGSGLLALGYEAYEGGDGRIRFRQVIHKEVATA